MTDEITRRTAVMGALSMPTAGMLMLDDAQPTGITFSPGIFIDGKTGKVTIPDGLSLDDASRAFWVAVETMFPVRGGCEKKTMNTEHESQ